MSWEDSPDYGGPGPRRGTVIAAIVVILAAGVGWAWMSGAFGR